MPSSHYPWRHFQYGGNHQAVCSGCLTTLKVWTQPWGDLTLPRSARAAVNDHLAACDA